MWNVGELNESSATGAAGFIGSALTLGLLKRGDVVVGIDNHNDYYDAGLKDKRTERIRRI